MIFRKAHKNDVDHLVRLVAELNEYHDDDTKINSKKLLEDWDWFECYVVVKDEDVLGFASGFDYYQFHATTRRFEIQNLHVSKKHRRQGVAKLLFDRIIELKKKQGVTCFCLGVSETNPNAIKFYEAMGFKVKSGANNLRYYLKF